MSQQIEKNQIILQRDMAELRNLSSSDFITLFMNVGKEDQWLFERLFDQYILGDASAFRYVE